MSGNEDALDLFLNGFSARDLAEPLPSFDDTTLLDCLQFADKGQIVARDESLRGQTRFASRRDVEEFVKALQDLRNYLAHSQDISGDWDAIHDLATNLHHIVLGSSAENELAPRLVGTVNSGRQ